MWRHVQSWADTHTHRSACREITIGSNHHSLPCSKEPVTRPVPEAYDPIDALAHHFLTTCSTTVLFMPSSSNSSLCLSRTKFCVPNLFHLAGKDDLLIMSTLHVYWVDITADMVPNFTLIAHACSACCGKITSRGWAFYDALAFLHYVAIDLNPGANRTIGILPFVGPLGYVMQPSNRGQHILLQECPNSLRLYFYRVYFPIYI